MSELKLLPQPETTVAPTTSCPDLDGHAALYSASERTWRLTAAQREAESLNGCPWCGGRR